MLRRTLDALYESAAWLAAACMVGLLLMVMHLVSFGWNPLHAVAVKEVWRTENFGHMQLMLLDTLLDIEWCNFMVEVLVVAGKPDEATNLIRNLFMNSSDKPSMKPNCKTLNMLLNGFAECGDVVHIEFLIEQLDGFVEGFPNLQTYSTLCKAHSRHGDVQSIIEIMAAFKETGIKANEYFYAELMIACLYACKSNDVCNGGTTCQSSKCMHMVAVDALKEMLANCEGTQNGTKRLGTRGVVKVLRNFMPPDLMEVCRKEISAAKMTAKNAAKRARKQRS